MSRSALLAVLRANTPRAKMAGILKKAVAREKIAKSQLAGFIGGLAGKAAPLAKATAPAARQLQDATAGVRGAQAGMRQAMRTMQPGQQALLASLKGRTIHRGSDLHRQLQQLGLPFRRAAPGGRALTPAEQQAMLTQASGTKSFQPLVQARQAAQAAQTRQQAMQQRLQRAHASTPGQGAWQAGQTVRRGVGAAAGATRQALQSPVGAAAAGGGAVAATNYGRDKLSALRVKIAARIINGDPGLEAIISHIKAARAKKTATSAA